MTAYLPTLFVEVVSDFPTDKPTMATPLLYINDILLSWNSNQGRNPDILKKNVSFPPRIKYGVNYSGSFQCVAKPLDYRSPLTICEDKLHGNDDFSKCLLG